jgi:hypothetical protein
VADGEIIELRLPTRAEIVVRPSQDQPGDWVVEANVESIDVQTGAPGRFTTTLPWHGGPPPRCEIAQAMINMLAHEVCEQLGIDPHARLALPERPTAPVVRMTDEEHAALMERVR